jgi:hypothetical protein
VGTVQFLNGTTVMGTSPVATGSATLALTGVVAGSYSYTAKFIPTSAAAFTPSTSSAVAFVVTAPVPTAVTTTTALAVSPATAVAPANATMTATVTGAGAAGSVEFFNGATSMGTSAVVAGLATKAMTGVAVGSYSYTATFIPTDATAFSPSTSSAATLVVTATVPVPSTAHISRLSPDEGYVGTKVTISGSGFGTVAGSVQFGASTAVVSSWTNTAVVFTVPARSAVTVSASRVPLWYQSEQKVLVTVTPQGGVASNAVRFELKSHHDGDDD